MSISRLKNRVSRLEKNAGMDGFSKFMGRYLEIISRQPRLLPCAAKNTERDNSEFEQLCRDYPQEAKKLDEWVAQLLVQRN